MVSTDRTRCDYIRNMNRGPYSISEACEIQRRLDETFPTTFTGCDLKWVDSKTGKPVVIGYSGTNSKPKKRLSKKENQKILDKRSALKSKENIKYMRRWTK